jgi:sporulation integral membrane protein YlbJ
MFANRLSASGAVIAVSATAAALMLLFPSESLTAAARGLGIWWEVLFPALFPFLVISELMLGFGVVHFFGALLDPLMRPLFRVPGIGGFVLAMGFASGYPVSARLTSQLWEQKLLTRSEGERLVSFATTADPIFLIGAVSVGFFHDVSLAPILAAAHYGAALLVGFAMRFVGRDGRGESAPERTGASGGGFPLVRALRAMHRARLADGRPLGVLLGQAVANSLKLVMVIGGLVVFFSVVIEVMTLARVMGALHAAVGSLFHLFAVPPALSQAVLNGIFEVTLGAKAAGAETAGVPLAAKVAIAAFVVSWGGLSVHAQVVSLLHQTNLRYGPFAFARALHAALAGGLVLLLWDAFQPLRGSAAAFAFTFLPGIPAARPGLAFAELALYSAFCACAALAGLLIMSLAGSAWKRIRSLFANL